SARASAASKSSMFCRHATSSHTARIAALDSIGASSGDRDVLILRDLTIPACRCQCLSLVCGYSGGVACWRGWGIPPIPTLHGVVFAILVLRVRICIARHPKAAFPSRLACITWGTGSNSPEAPPMAMTMNGEVQLAAPREAVWAKLNDPLVLKACIPGCEELEKTEDNGFRATAKMKVGPVSARFKGKVMLSDLDPPNGYKITG